MVYIQWNFLFTELRGEKKSPEIYITSKMTPGSQTNLTKKNKTEGIIFTDFKICHKSIVITTVWHSHKDKHINQWHRNESSEINPQL